MAFILTFVPYVNIRNIHSSLYISLFSFFQHRSFSKFNISGDTFINHQRLLRPRQNSVFVGSSMVTLPCNPPRKVKSAFDLQNLILSDPALNKSFTRINFRPDDFRRSSMLPTFNVYSEGLRRNDFELPHPSTGERRLSFKDIVEYEKPQQKYERVQCHMEKEPESEIKRQRKISETKQKSSMSNQSSMSDSRHNSITLQEITKPNRRSSILPSSLTPNIKELDVNELRPEIKSGVNSFRRNSMLLINSFENDRNFLNPRYGNDNIKSGVIDFRRNSMLIINNLNEDIGMMPSFGRNFSLGGSNVNLGDYPVVSNRRNSVIPPYAQPKTSIPHVAKVKNTQSKSLSVADNKYIANQKGSKSLDSNPDKRLTESPPISELRKQFLMPVVKCTGSTASLNTEVSVSGTNRTIDESRSTGNLSVEKSEFVQPKIIETRCSSPNTEEIKLDEIKTDNGFGDKFSSQLNLLANEEITEGDASEGKSKPVVNLTSSLSNINITSSIPMNVITSSDTAKRKPNTIQMSHV